MVDTALTARIEASLLRRINFEAFYFSSPGAAARFDREPLRFCAVLTDPVTLQRFRPRGGEPHLAYAGRDWYFLSDSTRSAFRAMPDSFSTVRLPMVPE